MLHHNDKLEHADVVAVFGMQDAAEEAVLGLRTAGFRDDRIGYFARDLAGIVTDYIWKGHTLLGAAVGILIGALVGFWAGNAALAEGDKFFAPVLFAGDTGMQLTAAVIGAVVFGLIGALTGWGIPRGDIVHRGTEMSRGRYVISVAAGDRVADAWAVIRRHGGHIPHVVDGVRWTPAI